MTYIDPLYLNRLTRNEEKTYTEIINRVIKTFNLTKYIDVKLLNEALHGCYFIPSSAIMLNANEDVLKDNSKRDIFSCYKYSVEDKMSAIARTMSDTMLLTAAGGGIGLDYSKVSSPLQNKNTNGIIPFIKANILGIKAVNQADTKKGNCTIYLDADHDEIDDFLEVHISKGDEELKVKNSFIAVKITDDFMNRLKNAIIANDLGAREYKIAKKIIKLRFETGRPFIYFHDNANRNKSEAYKDYEVTFSNLCTEILLHTVPGKASVCCLGSFHLPNLFKLSQEERITMIQTGVKILKVIYDQASAVKRDKDINCLLHYDQSVGIGAFGYADYIDSVDLEFNSPKAMKRLTDVFDIANEYGLSIGLKQVTAIAPTETISRLFGCSQNIELYNNREFVQKDGAGNNVKTITHKKLSSDYTAREHIKFTAEVQKHIHQSISLTLFYDVNVTEQTLLEDFLYAWKVGIKTLYYVKRNPVIVANSYIVSEDTENIDDYYNDEYGFKEVQKRRAKKDDNLLGGCQTCMN